MSRKRNKHGFLIMDKQPHRIHYIPAGKIKPTKRFFLLQAAWDKTYGNCWYCGQLLRNNSFQETRNVNCSFTVDHQTPLARGGENALSNIVPSCKKCNQDKGDMTLEEFRQSISPDHVFYWEGVINRKAQSAEDLTDSTWEEKGRVAPA